MIKYQWMIQSKVEKGQIVYIWIMYMWKMKMINAWNWFWWFEVVAWNCLRCGRVICDLKTNYIWCMLGWKKGEIEMVEFDRGGHDPTIWMSRRQPSSLWRLLFDVATSTRWSFKNFSIWSSSLEVFLLVWRLWYHNPNIVTPT